MRYAQIRSMDISNGKGVGVSLFVQGCPFRCHNCFNPETWDFKAEKEFIELANRPYIKRISILGGEPLADSNLKDVLNLVNKIRLLLPDKKIWLYTGYRFEECLGHIIRKEIILKCDVLVDGRYIDNLRDISLKWRGSSNQRVIDIKSTFEHNCVKLYTT